ncbi:hypothetical protein Tco_0958473 [Tanacetum coccineum]
MSSTMITQSVGQPAAASRGRGTGRRVSKGGGRTRGCFGDQGNGRNDGPSGQVGGQGSEVNGGVDGVLDFSSIIAHQLQNLLPTIVVQVGNQGRGQGVGRNQNGDTVNDHIRGDVGNATEDNDHRGCTYKELFACNLKEYDGIVRVKYPAGSLLFKAPREGNSKISSHGAITEKTIQNVVALAGTLTYEALRNGSIKKNLLKKDRKMLGESK